MERSEAIEIVREYYPSSGKDLNEALETLIPELKESEDEKTRKALLVFVKDAKQSLELQERDNNKWQIELLERYISWLEKQGENVYNEELSKLLHEVICSFINNPNIPYSKREEVSKKIIPYIEKLEKQGEQNLANSAKTCKIEQNPAWSEEDEDVINHLLAICAGAKRYRQFAGCLQEDITKYQTWLKSLKERYAWKPSDEQMELLREVQQALLGNDCHNRFVNFMYELKKLK